MTDRPTADALEEYAKSVRLDRRANPGIAGDGTALELLLAPTFHRLIERILAARFSLPPRVLPEYRRAGVGRPDLAFAREWQPARAFIELKQPGTSLDSRRLRGHDADQFRRFKELPLWGFCNFHTLHLYRLGELAGQAEVLPERALDPAITDAEADRILHRHDPAP